MSFGSELLRRQLQELAKNPPEGVSVGLGEDDNMFVWELMIIGPQDTLYEGGFFSAKLEFPQDFPNSPPVMTFLTPMWHPNGKCVVVYCPN
jgi:ubiquitin-conjugating enzyme E2 G1